jgi:tRNA(Ile)-lysidine synthase
MLCRVHGVKFHSKKVDIAALSKRMRVGIEQAGRQTRYSYFVSLSDRYGYTKIATGHTADDTAETFLLNLARGADIGGLRGIPPKRGKVIRPFIEISKADILYFLKEFGLSYRIDESNLENTYNRNIIRNELIAGLQKINPGALRHISKASEKIRESFIIVDDVVDKLYQRCLVNESNTQITLDLEKLKGYKNSLKNWILLRAYFRLTGSYCRPDSEKIERAVNLKRRGSFIQLDGGILVSNHVGRLILSKPQVLIGRITIRVGEIVKLGRSGLMIKTEKSDDLNLAEIKNNTDERIAYLDFDRVGKLMARRLKEGDRFKPLGMKGSKKVVDYLNDKGLPRIFKSSIPIVTSDGEIVWVAGFGIADSYKVTGYTKKVLKLQLFYSS